MNDTSAHKMPYKLEINLRRMSLHATGLSYWKKPGMQLKLKQYYYPYGKTKEDLQCLAAEVVQSIDSSILPSDLNSELVDIVKDIAYNMDGWFKYIRMRNVFRNQSHRQMYDKYFKDIYWTHYGTIDEVKILKYFWIKIPNVDFKKMYIMACRYCSPELIKELWGKLSPEERNFNYDKVGLHIVAYWNKLRENKLGEVMNGCISAAEGLSSEVYDTNKSLEVNMLRWSVFKGMVSAAKYFWDNLTEEEKNDNIDWCLTQVLECFHFTSEPIYFRLNKFCEIIFFFMNFLNENLKTDLFYKLYCDDEQQVENVYFSSIIEACLHSSPWKKFFMPLFNEFEYFFNQQTYNHLISITSLQPRNLMLKVWNRVPCDFRTAAGKNIDWVFLLRNWDLASIKVIWNDSSITPVRHEILKSLYNEDFIFELVKNKENQKLEQFINIILIPENLEMKEDLKLIYESLLKGEINSTYNFPDNVKNQICPKIICYLLIIQNQYDLVDKFLIWKFESQEEVKNFKRSSNMRSFRRWYLFDLWKNSEDVESAKNKSENILNWSYRDEMENNWTWHQIFGENNDIVPGTLNIDRYDNAIQKFKYIFPIAMRGLACELVQYGRLEKANEQLDWMFDDAYESRLNFMKSFLSTSADSYCCYLYISELCNPDRLEPLTKDEMRNMFVKLTNFVGGPKGMFRLLKEELSLDGDGVGVVISYREQYEEWDSDEELREFCKEEVNRDDGLIKVADFAECECWESSVFVENYKSFLSYLDTLC